LLLLRALPLGLLPLLLGLAALLLALALCPLLVLALPPFLLLLGLAQLLNGGVQRLGHPPHLILRVQVEVFGEVSASHGLEDPHGLGKRPSDDPRDDHTQRQGDAAPPDNDPDQQKAAFRIEFLAVLISLFAESLLRPREVCHEDVEPGGPSIQLLPFGVAFFVLALYQELHGISAQRNPSRVFLA